MSETHAKRARAQGKLMKRKEKAERKKVRRESEPVELAPGALEADYLFLQPEPEPESRQGPLPRT